MPTLPIPLCPRHSKSLQLTAWLTHLAWMGALTAMIWLWWEERLDTQNKLWFLGAATIRPLMSELLPTAKIVEHPRFSRLSYAGDQKMGRLPPKSALVGFSAAQVYETAERVRRLRTAPRA